MKNTGKILPSENRFSALRSCFFHYHIFKLSHFQIFILSFLHFSLFSQNSLDNLQYQYNSTNNRLNYITDAVSATTSTDDIDNQANDNYSYNAIGELSKDEAEGILEILWNSAGKVKQVSIDDNKDNVADRKLEFKYDALGNRMKKIESDLTTHNPQLTTYYARNAIGEVISIYQNNGSTNQRIETNIAGIGTDKITSDTSASGVYSRSIGEKNYELKDHLGNVRVVISDIKEPSNLSIFQSSILNSTDYYSYGMQMPGRDFNSSSYRYGFQKYEKDNEVKGNNKSYTTFFRQYDPRIGRWASMDPKMNAMQSPYSAMSNNPIMNIDLLGDTSLIFQLHYIKPGELAQFKGSRIAYHVQTTALDEKGVKIMVIDGNTLLGTYAFHDPRDAGTRTAPNGEDLPEITTLYLDGDKIAEQKLKDNVPDPGTMDGQKSILDFTYKESMSGRKIDFGFSINLDEMAIMEKEAYNNYDFGNFLWGAAIQKLGWSYEMAWAGSNYNAWYNEKIQNGFHIEGWTQDESKNMFNTNRLTWRSEDCFFCFDEKYDQSSIKNGYYWFKEKQNPQLKEDGAAAASGRRY